jgi:hypothetical protein
MRGIATAIAAAALFARSALADVDPIVIKGSKFFYKTNGTQFFIQGVAYQRTYLLSHQTGAMLTMPRGLQHKLFVDFDEHPIH